jgi:hypothetical protein
MGGCPVSALKRRMSALNLRPASEVLVTFGEYTRYVDWPLTLPGRAGAAISSPPAGSAGLGPAGAGTFAMRDRYKQGNSVQRAR